MRRAFVVLLSLVLWAPAFAQDAEEKGRVIERIVAVVDDKIVLLSEVESVVEDIMRAEPPPPGKDPARYREERRKEVLETLIAEKLIEKEIEKLRIEVSDQEVERIIESTKQKHGLDDRKLEAALAKQGLTLAEYREGLKKQLMKAKIIQLKVKSRVQVTDQDVKSTYAKRKALLQGDYKVRARHMLFIVPEGQDPEPARLRALAAKERLMNGADFAELAKKISDGPSAKNGGALGVFGRGEMVPEFEKAAFAAKPGEVVGPVRTPFGWHLILVEERVMAEPKPLEAMEEEIRQQLYEAEVERAFRSYVEDLKKQAYIDVRL